MGPEHRRFLNVQLAVSALLNAAISALFVWIVFGGRALVPLWGARGLAIDLVPTTFMITLMTAIALTLATRAAVRSGRLPRLDRRRRLPRPVLLRAPLLALAFTLALVPLSALLLSLVWTGDWSYRAVMAFKIAYGVGLGFLVTPVVVRAVLADRD
ncbi:MAG: hypothetical protein ACK40O_05065 [Allosphingosinicella sp.]